jgi:Putative transposase
MTLAATEFIRRFLVHVLPLGFHRIRYYDFLGPRHRAQKLTRCRQLLASTPSHTTSLATVNATAYPPRLAVRARLDTPVPGLWPGSTAGDRATAANPRQLDRRGYLMRLARTHPPASLPPATAASRASCVSRLTPSSYLASRHIRAACPTAGPVAIAHHASPPSRRAARGHDTRPSRSGFNSHRRCIRPRFSPIRFSVTGAASLQSSDTRSAPAPRRRPKNALD